MIALADSYHLTPEEYLNLEENSPIKHEYINGQTYAMAGTTDNHNTIAGNLYTLIRNHLRGTNCRVYFADIKAKLEKRNCFYYPDLLITCDPQDRETNTYKRFPKLIVEVLSDSTEAFDRGDKFNDYQSLDSLQEYVLIDSKKKRLEIYQRDSTNYWFYQSHTPLNPDIYFQSLDLRLNLTELYEDVEFSIIEPTQET
ncbi:MAG: Uma2 family endonuclease [Snowella sp.]|nr:Uma2 family endonuclease [Snowella sp.]